MHTSKYLKTELGTIHYKIPDEVKGPLVLFIHGASRDSQHTEFWDSILPIMEKYCTPVRMDNFGHGKSSFEGTPSFNDKVYAAEQMVHHLRSEYPDKEVFLVGRSLGGSITQVLVSRKDFAELISGIGLIAPAAREHARELLKDWRKPTSVLWDVNDPAVSFSGYEHIKAVVPNVHLFTVGEHPDSVGHVPETKPSHAPELLSPEAFEMFLKDLLGVD